MGTDVSQRQHALEKCNYFQVKKYLKQKTPEDRTVCATPVWCWAVRIAESGGGNQELCGWFTEQGRVRGCFLGRRDAACAGCGSVDRDEVKSHSREHSTSSWPETSFCTCDGREIMVLTFWDPSQQEKTLLVIVATFYYPLPQSLEEKVTLNLKQFPRTSCFRKNSLDPHF